MQVALYFGSFNPIHLGHLAVAQAVLEQTDCTELWFVISPHNPLKSKGSLLGEIERLKLVQEAIALESNMKASNIEFSMPQPSYTWDTMQALKKQYPNNTFSIVMGGDSFASITKWKNYEELLSNNDIILYKREGATIDPTLCARLITLNVPFINISATTIRSKIKKQEPFRHLVSDTVWTQLMKTGYYK